MAAIDVGYGGEHGQEYRRCQKVRRADITGQRMHHRSVRSSCLSKRTLADLSDEMQTDRTIGVSIIRIISCSGVRTYGDVGLCGCDDWKR